MYNRLLVCGIQKLDRVQSFMSKQQSELIRNQLLIYRSGLKSMTWFGVFFLHFPLFLLFSMRTPSVLLSQSTLSVQGCMRDPDRAVTHFAGSLLFLLQTDLFLRSTAFLTPLRWLSRIPPAYSPCYFHSHTGAVHRAHRSARQARETRWLLNNAELCERAGHRWRGMLTFSRLLSASRSQPCLSGRLSRHG